MIIHSEFDRYGDGWDICVGCSAILFSLSMSPVLVETTGKWKPIWSTCVRIRLIRIHSFTILSLSTFLDPNRSPDALADSFHTIASIPIIGVSTYSAHIPSGVIFFNGISSISLTSKHSLGWVHSCNQNSIVVIVGHIKITMVIFIDPFPTGGFTLLIYNTTQRIHTLDASLTGSPEPVLPSSWRRLILCTYLLLFFSRVGFRQGTLGEAERSVPQRLPSEVGIKRAGWKE